MNQEYQQALYELERLRENARLVDPDFYDVVDLEVRAAEARVNAISKEVKRSVQ